MKRILLSISIFIIISTTIFCLAACKGNIETPNLPDTDENETPPTPVEYVVRFDTVGGNEILSVKELKDLPRP